jgi:sugar phosphate isomerase/epimerase
MSHPLSVQLYTVRDALAADPATALERLAGLGLTTVEPFDLVAHADSYAELLPRFGLTPSSAHVTLLGADLVPVIRAAKKVGVTTLIDPMLAEDRWQQSDSVIAAAGELNAIAAIAGDEGITVGYHNHWWELESRMDGTTALEVFTDYLDPAVVLEVDTYWAEVGGVSAVDLLGRLGNRVHFLHVKDGDISKDNTRQMPAGSGSMSVLQVLAAAPHAVRVIEFDDYAEDVFDGIAASIAFLTAHGESL